MMTLVESIMKGPGLHDNMEDHIMSTMMDVLQTCGVSAADSANYCARVIKDKPMKASQSGDHYKPTLFEVYGQEKHCASITRMSKKPQCRWTLSI